MRARHRGREGTLKRSTCRASLSPLRREVARRLEAGRRCGVKPGQHILLQSIGGSLRLPLLQNGA
jgi:hypothetical protein